MPNSVVEEIEKSYIFQEATGKGQEFLELSKMFLYWLFSRPHLYSYLARLPFLRLGETIVSKKYRSKNFSTIQALSILGWLNEKSMITSVIKENCKLWVELLKGTNLIQPYIEKGLSSNHQIVPIRYPILFAKKEDRDAAYNAMARKGLGVSVSYPEAITGYEDFKDFGLIPVACPNAESVAQRILTLPVHPYVSKKAIYKAYRILKEYI